MGLKLSRERFSGGMQPPPAKGPFFIFLLMMPAFLGLIVLLLIAMQYKQLRSFVSEKPMALDSIPDSPEAQERVRLKIHDFLTGAGHTDSVPVADTLMVTKDDLNQLTRGSRALADMHLDYHLDMDDSLLIARNSLPVSHLNGFMATMARALRIHGFLNSEMKGRPEFKDGVLSIVPVSAVMNGVAAPVSVLDSKGRFDMREWVSDKDGYDKAVAKLSGIRIRSGELILTRRH
ncbi:MAG: hypothetical protein ABIW76_08055 [Fibrobacteria bacterium]